MFKPTSSQIRDYVASNFEYKSRKGGDELVINNPFDGDTGFHFNVSVSKAVVYDWRGNGWARGSSPTFLRFVQLHNKCSFAKAIKLVCGDDVNFEQITNKIRESKVKKKQEEFEKDKAIKMMLPKGSKKILDSDEKTVVKIVIAYLKFRGVGEDLIRQYDLYHYLDSIVWPYYEYEDLVYYQGRSAINKRFFFPSLEIGVGKSQFLYGFDMVEPSDYLILTEAIFDTMTLGQQSVASGGATITKGQLNKVRALNPINGVILAPDNDKAGMDSVMSNYKLIAPYFKIFYSVPPKKIKDRSISDWNDVGQSIGFSAARKMFEERISRITPESLIAFI